MEPFSFPADDALRRLAVEACREVNPEIQVFEGRIASGDQFVSDQKVKDRIVKEFGAYAAEMEGAAVAQAAWLNGIPFLVIRAISDKAACWRSCRRERTETVPSAYTEAEMEKDWGLSYV